MRFLPASHLIRRKMLPCPSKRIGDQTNTSKLPNLIIFYMLPVIDI